MNDIMMLTGRYETSLVLVSILVAIFASYTALSLAGRVTKSQGTVARWWIFGGAMAMGIGIWSMHFIGMLAFRLPIPIGYDLVITALSLLLPITVSAMALWQVSRSELPAKRLAIGALLMGVGINSMHYTGMAAMRMSPPIVYDPWLFLASICIAIVASGAALWIAFRLRHNRPAVWIPRLGASVIMGFAIVGMHYTGMAAANFPLGSICLAAAGGVGQNSLAVMVIIGTLAVLTVALLTSVYDAQLDSRLEVLSLSQATADERQRLLERERAAREEAERLSEIKDEFLATLSHELRTPLNAILGWSQILRDGARDETVLRKGLDTIERNARAQSQLIDDLLDMSRIISGKIRLKMEDVAPSFFIEAAMETVRPAAESKGILLETDFQQDVPGIRGDVNRLQQVMWNLLSNAVKFTPEGGRISIKLESSHRQVAIAVTDSGIGIKPDFIDHIFDRFWQADASTTRRYSGLGLGLSIVRHLVELHGGSVTVSSRGEGQGATFHVRLPITQGRPVSSTDAPQQANSVLSASLAFQPADLSQCRALVVDDDADARELIERILLDCGATVFAASNAMDALSLLKKHRPDVVVSDIGMPDIDGYELIRRVRALDASEGGATSAVALTAFTRADDHKKALEAGFDRHMRKPLEPSTLVATIVQLLNRSA